MEEVKPIVSDEVLLQENRNLQILQRSLVGALKEVFGEYTESQRFLDLKRIPLICKDIANINKSLETIADSRKSQESDHEARLRSLETFMNTLTGKIVIMSVMVSGVISFFAGMVLIIVQHYWK